MGPSPTGWTYGELWETVADTLPDAPCLAQGDRRLTWQEVDRRADGVATALVGAGLGHQDKVAQYLYNCPEYLESVFACFKAALVPVNTNYRYVDDELVHLWDNGDVAAVVFHGSFTASCERVRDRVPGVRLWLWVDDGTGPCPTWAEPYEAAATSPPPERYRPAWGRSPDDLYLVYTGGTTGLPKGVMWRQEDLFLVGNRTAKVRYPVDADDRLVASMLTEPGPVHVPVPPLMHATGSITSFAVWGSGGSVVLLPGRSFDAGELFDTIDAERAASVVIVGDVHGKPMLEALDAAPGRWDLSTVRVLSSTGAMWSAPVKERLSAHLPRAILVDTLGSSEAPGIASSVTRAGEPASTARFSVTDDTRVLTEDGRWVEPGSGERGLLARRGATSLGYYKDAEKTATTVRTVDGQRWMVPGDWATVEADGTISLLGRGSGTINTGGEKVFPEEVEEALKTDPAVRDVVVVGVPDDRFGETVCAVVELEPGASATLEQLRAACRDRIAAYKAPRRLLVVGSLERQANGKVDRASWQARAAAGTS
ncbi:MAG: AMP-binding protein [Acidimicrobiia bacterium]